MFGMLRPVLFGLAVAALPIVICLQPGCQRTASEGTKVRGLVSFQGRPLSGGLVAFSPDPDRGGSGKPMCAEIASDGLFQLTVSGDLLIPEGWYRVTIAPNPSTALSTSQDRVAFPPQLARPDRSGLVRQVLPGRENYFEFCISVSGGD